MNLMGSLGQSQKIPLGIIGACPRTHPERTQNAPNEERKAMKKRNYDKINKMLEMPQEVYSDIPKITMIGFDEMIIENFKGILEYEEYFVRINTHVGIVNVNGFNLNLENMTEDDIKVTGKIESMDIERTVD